MTSDAKKANVAQTKTRTPLWKIYLFFLVLGLLIIAGVYIIKTNQPQIEQLKKITGIEAPSTQKSIADTYLINAVISSYAATGKLNYQLDAETLENFDNENSIKMTKPKILHLEDKPMQATSMQGVLHNKEKLRLDGKVVLQQLDENARLNTEHLDINLATKEISNNIAVIFTSDNAKITGKGLKANLQSEKIQLKNRVRGVYEP